MPFSALAHIHELGLRSVLQQRFVHEMIVDDNFRAPEPLRLHPKEPFVCFAPSQLGEWRIEPGRPHVARYRFVVTDGPADRALLEACWQAFAQPAVATVTAK